MSMSIATTSASAGPPHRAHSSNIDAENSTSDGAGTIRWRHQKNTMANFLFVDGHVESRQYKNRNSVDLKLSNINVNK